MEKVYGTSERHDQLIVFKDSNKATLIYGYGEDDGQGYDLRHTFDHIPTREEVRNVIYAYINQQTDLAILSGYTFEGHMVWLNTENQFNYKAAYDLALQTGGATLPITAKLGNDDAPYYRDFNDIETFAGFYIGAVQHIQQTLGQGWILKSEAAIWVESLPDTIFSA